MRRTRRKTGDRGRRQPAANSLQLWSAGASSSRFFRASQMAKCKYQKSKWRRAARELPFPRDPFDSLRSLGATLRVGLQLAANLCNLRNLRMILHSSFLVLGSWLFGPRCTIYGSRLSLPARGKPCPLSFPGTARLGRGRAGRRARSTPAVHDAFPVPRPGPDPARRCSRPSGRSRTGG